MFSQVTYTGNGSNTVFALPFPYLSTFDILVYVGGVQNNTFTFVDSSHINITPAPANGAVISIQRATAITFADVVFTDGSTLRGADLNTEFNQVLYGLQEVTDLVNNSRVQAGALPVVTSANNTNLLQVVSGVWTATTLTNFVSSLSGSTDNSIQAGTGVLKVALADTSLQTTGSGVSVKLLTTGGLSTVPGGVQVLGRDTSLVIGGLGVGVNVVAAGGLNINNGLYVRGMQVIAGDVGSPVDGDTWYNSTSAVFKQRLHNQTITYGGLLFINGPGSAVVNTAALTSASSGPLNANFLAVGKVIRVKTTILYSNTGTPTLLVGLYANGTANPLSSLTLPITTGTGGAIEAEFLVRVVTAGSGGTADCMGHWHLSQAGAAASTFIGANVASAVNTTIADSLAIALQWSVASASNTATVQSMVAEVLQ